MTRFTMNGYLWRIVSVSSYDPILVDRTGNLTVATPDPKDLCIYISDEISGSFLLSVLVHELGHCAIYSFNLLNDIHRMVHPKYWVEAEEWVCNFIADYGLKIFKVAYKTLGDDAIDVIPYEIERLIA